MSFYALFKTMVRYGLGNSSKYYSWQPVWTVLGALNSHRLCTFKQSHMCSCCTLVLHITDNLHFCGIKVLQCWATTWGSFFWCGYVEPKKPHTATVIVKMIVLAVVVIIIISLDQGDYNICPALHSKAMCCVRGLGIEKAWDLGFFSLIVYQFLH